MIVVSDTSPLIALRKIGLLSVLPALFKTVIIPSAVAKELTSGTAKDGGIDILAENPWLSIRDPQADPGEGSLGAGETAAIALALEVRPFFLLIDDRAGRKAAEERQLRSIGTVGVLELAAVNGLVDLATAFELLTQTDFRVSRPFLEGRLKLFLSRQTGGSAS